MTEDSKIKFDEATIDLMVTETYEAVQNRFYDAGLKVGCRDSAKADKIRLEEVRKAIIIKSLGVSQDEALRLIRETWPADYVD